jgi:hypothetical protein
MGNNRVSKRDADKERRWRGLIDEQKQIGQSVRGFCHEQGLKEASFYRWRQVIRQRDRETMQAEASTSALAPWSSPHIWSREHVSFYCDVFRYDHEKNLNQSL